MLKLIIVLSFFIISCDTCTNPTNYDNQFVGTWQRNYCNYTFYNTGDYLKIVDSFYENGTWYADSSKVYLKRNNVTHVLSYEFCKKNYSCWFSDYMYFKQN